VNALHIFNVFNALTVLGPGQYGYAYHGGNLVESGLHTMGLSGRAETVSSAPVSSVSPFAAVSTSGLPAAPLAAANFNTILTLAPTAATPAQYVSNVNAGVGRFVQAQQGSTLLPSLHTAALTEYLDRAAAAGDSDAVG